jgi:2-methylisocitrate lyase-like PEP mutase family enzyme
MAVLVADKRARFRKLHEAGCFIIPNPWDVGSARVLQALGFQALATTSSGFAWSRGGLDNQTPIGDMLAHFAELSAAVDLPINADFENGFGDAPEDVAANVTRALATGVAGLSIEDQAHDAAKSLYEASLAVERMRAARAAMDADGTGAVLVGRAEGRLGDRAPLAAVLDRLATLADAGADCLYAPGLRTADEIAEAVKAVAPKPLNVLVSTPGFSRAALADLGVRRISVGGGLARVAWGAAIKAARAMAEDGSFEGFAGAATGGDMQGLLGS